MKTYLKNSINIFYVDINKLLDRKIIQDDVLKEFKSLYLEIKNLKNYSDFKRYGFTKSDPYSSWLIRVRNL